MYCSLTVRGFSSQTSGCVVVDVKTPKRFTDNCTVGANTRNASTIEKNHTYIFEFKYIFKIIFVKKLLARYSLRAFILSVKIISLSTKLSDGIFSFIYILDFISSK